MIIYNSLEKNNWQNLENKMVDQMDEKTFQELLELKNEVKRG